MAAGDLAEGIEAGQECEPEGKRDCDQREPGGGRSEDRRRADEDEDEGAEQLCDVLLPGIHANLQGEVTAAWSRKW